MSSPFVPAPSNYVCNRSILSGSFPNRLKYSKRAIKRYKNDFPMSLLNSFQKMIYTRLSEYVKNYDIY
jgi:hypothetical protein